MRSPYRRFVRPGDPCYDLGASSGERTEIFRALGRGRRERLDALVPAEALTGEAFARRRV